MSAQPREALQHHEAGGGGWFVDQNSAETVLPYSASHILDRFYQIESALSVDGARVLLLDVCANDTNLWQQFPRAVFTFLQTSTCPERSDVGKYESARFPRVLEVVSPYPVDSGHQPRSLLSAYDCVIWFGDNGLDTVEHVLAYASPQGRVWVDAPCDAISAALKKMSFPVRQQGWQALPTKFCDSCETTVITRGNR
ncbi:hypothetical protein LRY65_05930 [Candidatus Woesebacteria bacterium]|nr:hypothetical protein [Candidatus Woesebacteria bacterium]MCD8506790.1 hypothetical protein [Candidatus Woesebacteria bacterium]MCD8527699.1 hypothetical protein [Candidatus Woesebacteria bacterium]MCD8546332.1 hypothetical protein [Candidatus Woesebacteria bacterium]